MLAKSRWRRTAALAAAFGVALSIGTAARRAQAQAPAPVPGDTNAARTHYERGTRFYDLGKYDDAVREFEAAYEAKGDPAFLYNLAQSHRLAGHVDEALRFYRTYLRYVPKAPNRADIEAKIKTLEKTAAEHPGTTTPPGTGTTPPPGGGPATGPGTTPPGSGTGGPMTGPGTTTPPGSTGTSTPPSSGTTTPPGTTGGEPGPGTTTSPMNGPPATGGPPPSTYPPPAPRPRSSGARTAGVVIAGIGGAFVVGGAVFGLLARSAEKKIETAGRNGEQFDPDVDKQGKRSALLQWIGYGVGGAALITGIVIIATAHPAAETPPSAYPSAGRVALAPLYAPGVGGAVLKVTF